MGCASGVESPWALSFEPAGKSQPPSDTVRIVPAPIETLETNPEMEGATIVGTSHFTDVRQDTDPSDPSGPLAKMARAKGATLVRLGIRPAGTETRTEYVRTTIPETAPPSGNIARGHPPSTRNEQIPIDVKVDVFEHLAVFYRENG